MKPDVWDAKTIGLVLVAIVTLGILFEARASWGGLLILASLVTLTAYGLRRQTIERISR